MCEVENVHELALKEAEELVGVWRVVSNKDNRDRQVMVMNQPGNDALIWMIKDHNGNRHRCAVLPEDARQFAIGILQLLDKEKPEVGDAWSINEASIGPVD